MLGRSNEALVRRAIEAIWNRCELDVADELFAPDYVNHDGLIPDLVYGPEAIKISVALYRRAFPDLHITVEKLSTKGETVVLHWTAQRQPPGRRGDGTLTANQRLLTGVTRSRLTGGKIMESWTEWDSIPRLPAKGLMPSD
jgi:predicted SnoaL-like aldol condensation-catalyzing enzyme